MVCPSAPLMSKPHLISHNALLHCLLSASLHLHPSLSSSSSPSIPSSFFSVSFCPSRRPCAEISIIMQLHTLCSLQANSSPRPHMYSLHTHAEVQPMLACNSHPSCTCRGRTEPSGQHLMDYSRNLRCKLLYHG